MKIVLSTGFKVTRINSGSALRMYGADIQLAGPFFYCFIALGAAGFPLWQRLGIASLLPVVYGLSCIKRGESRVPNRIEEFDQAGEYRALKVYARLDPHLITRQ